MAARKRIYKVIFTSQGKQYELYARRVTPAELHGFVEVEELLFGERSAILLDPTEEQLKHEFAGVRRSFIPYHAIQRIDEVEREGRGRITSSGGDDKVLPFPQPLPGRKPDTP